MASMNLTEFFKDKQVYSWAKENDIPGPRIAEAILHENDQGGRPLGPSLAAKMVIASGGQIRLGDLIPKLAAQIKEALDLEVDHG